MARHLMTIQELNRYPFVETGHCWQCGENFKLTQLSLPEPSRILMQLGTDLDRMRAEIGHSIYGRE